MMGYSITEAASVLGVPTERVWELLARGVLAGEPEGETGMRVFLQPRPAPAPVAPADDTITARSNGPERELSPFRELLTEFRSLTERYGQALLALGESRGEVASLRSRVDMLEARIDLRLPMGQPGPAPWPTQSLPVGEAAAAPRAEAAVGSEPEAEHEEDAHRPRRRRARRATEGFAEALARAEDPSLSDLAGAADADALAAFRSEADVTDVEAADADRVLPREVLPAEPVLVADEADLGEPVAVETTAGEAAEAAAGEPVIEDTEERASELVEPELAAESDAATVEPEPAIEAPEIVDAWAEPLDALATPVDVGPEPVDVEPEPAPPEEPAAAPEEPAAAPEEPAAAAEALEDAWITSLRATEPEPWPEFEVASETADGSDPGLEQVTPEPEPPGSAVDVEPAEFDAQRYTSAIEQPDWFEAEADDPWPTEAQAGDPTADDAESFATADVPPAGEPRAPDEIGADSAPADGAAETPADRREPGGGEAGADEMEVAGGGHGGASVQQEPEPESEPEQEPEQEPESERQPESEGPDPALPGSRELDEALEAFGDLGSSAPARGREDDWPPATPGADRITPSVERAGGFVSGPLRQSYGAPMPSGPATRAYRRLRRIFPT